MAERPLPNWLKRAAVTMTAVGAIGFGASAVDNGINGVKIIKEIRSSSDKELAKPSETIDFYHKRAVLDMGVQAVSVSFISAGLTILYISRRKQNDAQNPQSFSA